VVAHAGYPGPDSSDPEPEKHTITIVVPSGATVIGLMPGDDQVKVRHEGMASPKRDVEVRASVRVPATQESRPRDSLLVVDDEPPPEDEARGDDEPALLAETSSDDVSPAVSEQSRPRRWRLGVTTLLSLGLLTGGLFEARVYLPEDVAPPALVDWVERWKERVESLPRVLRERAARLELPSDDEPADER
jgi:hypothetical protein